MLTPEREKALRKQLEDPHGYSEMEELFVEIDRLRSSIKPWTDQSDCQLFIEITLKEFDKGFARGIIAFKDGTLVNLGVKINVDS